MTATTPPTPPLSGPPPGRVIVLQLKRLGDLILTTPALTALRAAWPGTHLTVVTEAPFHEILAGFPGIDALLIHPRGPVRSVQFGERLAHERADLVLDFQGSTTSARLALQSRAPRRIGWGRRIRRLAYTAVVPGSPPAAGRFTGDQKLDFLRLVGLAPGVAVPALTVTAAARAGATRLLRDAGLSPGAGHVILAPASRRAYKQWAPASWARLLSGLESAGIGPILLAGGPGEVDQVDEVRAACLSLECAPPSLAVPDLPSWMGLLADARLMIGPDGGVRQIAQALGRPTFGLFGPQNPAHWVCPVPPGRNRGMSGRRPACAVRCSTGSAPCACLAALPPERVLSEILSGVRTTSGPSLG